MKRKLKTFTFILTLALSLCSLAAFAACGAPKENVTITVSQKEMRLTVGESAQLNVSVEPADAMDKRIEWKTSNKKIVTVENGKITAIAEGEATVTATTNGKSDSCKVTVVAADEGNISGGNSSGSNSSEENNPQSGGTPDSAENGASGDQAQSAS